MDQQNGFPGLIKLISGLINRRMITAKLCEFIQIHPVWFGERHFVGTGSIINQASLVEGVGRDGRGRSWARDLVKGVGRDSCVS